VRYRLSTLPLRWRLNVNGAQGLVISAWYRDDADRPGWRERTTFSKRNKFSAGGYEYDQVDLLEDPPYQPPRSAVAPRLTTSAVVLGAVAGAIVAFGVLRQPANSAATPPPAVVPVIVGSTPQATASPSAAFTATPSAATATASASPRVSPSARVTRSSPSPSQSPSFSPSPSPSPAASRLPLQLYEGDASANILTGRATVASCSGCPDGTKVGYVGYDGTLTFPDVAASVAGYYVLEIVYVEGSTSGARQAVVTVDGTDFYENFPGDGDWQGTQTLRLTVQLAAGANSVELSNPNAWGPDIAGIVV
jgi:hypothetical protein